MCRGSGKAEAIKPILKGVFIMARKKKKTPAEELQELVVYLQDRFERWDYIKKNGTTVPRDLPEIRASQDAAGLHGYQ